MSSYRPVASRTYNAFETATPTVWNPSNRLAAT